MSQTNEIRVRVYAKDGEVYSFGAGGVQTGTAVHYLSFVNDESYGVPKVISERRYKEEGLPLRVLYVNPANVLAVEAERTA